MGCNTNFPIEQVVEVVKSSINISELGGVLESELEQKILLYTQRKFDAIQERINNMPTEKFVVSQELIGNELVLKLSDETELKTDLSSLL